MHQELDALAKGGLDIPLRSSLLTHSTNEGFSRQMKAGAKDHSRDKVSAAGVHKPVPSVSDIVAKPPPLDERGGSEMDCLRARVDELESALEERDSLRQQAEQALALTRRQFSRLLEQNAPLRQTAIATMSIVETSRSELEKVESGLSQTRHQLAVTESALLQKREENAQAWSEIALIRTRITELEHKFQDQVALTEDVEKELIEANRAAFKLAGERREAERALSRAEQALQSERRAREIAEHEARALKSLAEAAKEELDSCQGRLQLAEERRAEACDEIVAITRFLRASESIAEEREGRIAWFAGVAEVLNSSVPWWVRILPRRWARSLLLRRLATNHLFDGKEYLRRNPDVSEAGQDPLRHYIAHGIREGRQI